MEPQLAFLNQQLTSTEQHRWLPISVHGCRDCARPLSGYGWEFGPGRNAANPLAEGGTTGFEGRITRHRHSCAA